MLVPTEEMRLDLRVMGGETPATRLILVEHLLDSHRILGPGQRELQQHARLGRIELARRDEAHLVVVHLVVAQHEAGASACCARRRRPSSPPWRARRARRPSCCRRRRRRSRCPWRRCAPRRRSGRRSCSRARRCTSTRGSVVEPSIANSVALPSLRSIGSNHSILPVCTTPAGPAIGAAERLHARRVGLHRRCARSGSRRSARRARRGPWRRGRPPRRRRCRCCRARRR